MAPFELPAEPIELGEDDPALDRIHPSADSDAGVFVAPTLPMHAYLAEYLREMVIIREHCAAIAVAT
jgi:hypothetical protein